MRHYPLIALLLLVSLAGSAAAETVVLQPDVDTGRDTFVVASFPGTAMDGWGVLWVEAEGGPDETLAHTYLAFDALDEHLGRTVAAAELHLYIKNLEGGGTFTLGAVDGEWSEAELSWNNRPGTYERSRKLLPYPGEMNAWHTIDVTDYVQAWLDETIPNHGFCLYDDDDEAAFVSAYAADEWSEAEHFPKLIIEFVNAAGGF